MNASKMLRFGLTIGLFAVLTASTEASKAKDARFVNPHNPEGKVKAVNRNAHPIDLQRAPKASKAPPRQATPRAVAQKSNSQVASREAARSNHSASENRRSGWNSSNHHVHAPSRKHVTVHEPRVTKNYHSHSQHRYKNHSGLTISIGGTYSTGGFHTHNRHSRHRHHSSTSWGFGWNRPVWGYSPTYAVPAPVYYPPASNVVIYNNGYGASHGSSSSGAYYGSGTYYGSPGGPWPYQTTAYQVQAQPTMDAYHDWQRSSSQLPAGEAIVIPSTPYSAAPDQSTASPSQRQIEAVLKGWALVAEGRAREAVTVFAIECELDGQYAPAKVGYAVSSALAGEGSAARWGMRRALAVSAGKIAYLPSIEGLTNELDRLSGSLWRDMAGKPVSADDWFLVASVDYLRHDLESALRAAQEAAKMGDDSPSLRNLLIQIQTEVGR